MPLQEAAPQVDLALELGQARLLGGLVERRLLLLIADRIEAESFDGAGGLDGVARGEIGADGPPVDGTAAPGGVAGVGEGCGCCAWATPTPTTASPAPQTMTETMTATATA